MSKVSLNTPAPDFELADFTGKTVNLSAFQGKNVVLVFNRGFFWPFCRRHMAQLRQDYQEFVRREAVVIVVGPEDKAAFAAFWRENDLPFYGLPDPKVVVLKRYGQEVNLFKLGRMPAQVIIDRQGIVRYAHFGHSMSDIPDNCELLSILDMLNLETGTYNKMVEVVNKR